MAGGGGKEPNLTAFIDLFSVLIVFLLMTAAWTQLESMQVQLEKKPSENLNPANPESPPTTQLEKKTLQLSLLLDVTSIELKEGEKTQTLMVNGLELATPELLATLARWKESAPPEQSIVINSTPKATYGQLIRLYDIVISAGWTNVGISPN